MLYSNEQNIQNITCKATTVGFIYLQIYPFLCINIRTLTSGAIYISGKVYVNEIFGSSV